ncbi:efflux RND transporter periplasmic adaptor subunit [Shimia sp. FJ5]|uniref:efflux RND transporter periplasmic adaptor subunit n=1 Tax=Shimia sp. FJ5 TaxID=3079054 RepID=UPI002603D76A|nr:HlyD family efflux transporter periplasmic adaptor subunit [Shimia sp. FJ5]MDV4145932.1 HlyD family efflux transporter periplasmic adaptor subunit [Shimia sp. FJ5]
MATRKSRNVLMIGVVGLVAAALAAAFWPQPTEVDLGTVKRGAMRLTVDEEARTQVRDPYVVSTPIAGHLLRVDLQPGDRVTQGETIVARMLPTNPAALDIRTREQAGAAIDSAKAALRVAEADLNKALSDRDLAQTALERARKLFAQGNISQAAMERSESAMRTAQAVVDTARAAISMRVADLNNAEANLISFDNIGQARSASEAIDLPSPITGVVLRVIQESETILPAGTPVLEIGDTANDLEVVVELLSSDAVRVAIGDPVEIDNWGGDGVLNGMVERIDPFGFTKFSALGVEEQRVNSVIRFTDPPEQRGGLGHGFRVEARIIVWQDEDTLIAPSSALFRHDDGWAVFVIREGHAVLTPIEIGRNNGFSAQILDGLDVGAEVVLYPSATLVDGARIAARSAG